MKSGKKGDQSQADEPPTTSLVTVFTNAPSASGPRHPTACHAWSPSVTGPTPLKTRNAMRTAHMMRRSTGMGHGMAQECGV